MKGRTCATCGKPFRYPSDLKAHQARKTPCAPILEREDLPVAYGDTVLEDPDLENKKCRFCGRIFSTYTAMRRHVRRACKIAPNAKNGDTGMELLYEHTIRKQQEQIERLTHLVETMVARGVQPAAAHQNSGNQAGEAGIQGDHGTINQDRRVYNIHIFGQETLDHVTLERIRGILNESLKTPSLPAAATTAVVETAMLVYSDPERPENLTCLCCRAT